MAMAAEVSELSAERLNRFLVVEDSPELAEVIRKGLTDQAARIDITHSGRDGEEAAVAGQYDMILLDIMLPDHDGRVLCQNLRRRGVMTPVLMLTGLSAATDKVAGLEAGSDDYLTKPFELDELLARVRALLRRARLNSARLGIHDIEMDLIKRTVCRAGKPIVLTAREFALLELFLRNPDRVLTRTQIGKQVWDLVFEDDSNVIEVYVSRLRCKVDRGFDRRLIHTVVGTGYRLSAEAAA